MILLPCYKYRSIACYYFLCYTSLLLKDISLCNGFGLLTNNYWCRHHRVVGTKPISSFQSQHDTSIQRQPYHYYHLGSKRCSSSTLIRNHHPERLSSLSLSARWSQNDIKPDNVVDVEHDIINSLTTEWVSSDDNDDDFVDSGIVQPKQMGWSSFPIAGSLAVATSAVAVALLSGNGDIVSSSYAADSINDVATNFQGLSQGTLNPANFQPVCPTSDGFYRILQSSTITVIGKENFVEYGPLIAGGLLRIRLELCVVESFFNEAVGPFIAENGLSWVLPLRETVETFIAGGIFAIATTFILIGSTKLLTVIATYTDFIFGVPSRLLGGYTFDRAQGKPVTLDIGLGPFKTRLIGPPDTKPGEEPQVAFDLANTNVLTLLILFVSGTVKAVGEVLGVSFSMFSFNKGK
jgi:hypothetical protein